jgi:hypothetical protein
MSRVIEALPIRARPAVQAPVMGLPQAFAFASRKNRVPFLCWPIRNTTMIVSFYHNFIYFRPKKTGSSTIEEVLCQSLAPGDIIAGTRALRVPGQDGSARVPEGLVAQSKPEDIIKRVSMDFLAGCFLFA